MSRFYIWNHYSRYCLTPELTLWHFEATLKWERGKDWFKTQTYQCQRSFYFWNQNMKNHAVICLCWQPPLTKASSKSAGGNLSAVKAGRLSVVWVQGTHPDLSFSLPCPLFILIIISGLTFQACHLYSKHILRINAISIFFCFKCFLGSVQSSKLGSES